MLDKRKQISAARFMLKLQTAEYCNTACFL